VSNAAPFVLLVGVAVVFWFLMVRPAQRRQRDQVRMQSAIGEGDDVMLTSGIFGTVRALDEETVRLEVADGVELRVVRAAVGRIVTPTERARDDESELVDRPADELEEK
jgi:preprotein translocase subunit YajC